MADITAKLEDRIEKIAGKLLPKKLFDRPLPEQVVMQRKFMGMIGMANVRAGLLKDQGLPADIRDMLKASKSSEEIKAYYWNCEPFRKFWQDMEMSESYLDTLIKDVVTEYANKGW